MNPTDTIESLLAEMRISFRKALQVAREARVLCLNAGEEYYAGYWEDEIKRLNSELDKAKALSRTSEEGK